MLITNIISIKLDIRCKVRIGWHCPRVRGEVVERSLKASNILPEIVRNALLLYD